MYNFKDLRKVKDLKRVYGSVRVGISGRESQKIDKLVNRNFSNVLILLIVSYNRKAMDLYKVVLLPSLY